MNRWIVTFLTILSLSGISNAGWEPDPSSKAQGKAAVSIEKFRDQMPRTAPYFEEAYGYAVFYTVGRVGAGFGASYGRGFVFEGDRLIGTTRLWQVSSGIQAGVNVFRMIIFFKDKEALEEFKLSRMQFLGQAGASFATFGVSRVPAYNQGVAIFSQTRAGLMLEASASGAKFRFKPFERMEEK